MQNKILKIILIAVVFFMLSDFVRADVNTIIADPANVTDCGTLNQSSTTYTLQNDVVSDGSCFAITASDVVFNLNNKSVTYDNAAPISFSNGSFEDGTGASADNWDMSAALNAQRAAGTFVQPVTLFDGAYALKVNTPTIDQTVTSVGTVTLAANTRYSLSGMVYDMIGSDIVMSIELSSTIKASQTGQTWRGFQYITKEFITGSTPEIYNVTLRVSGATAAVAGAVYFDDIKIQRNRLVGVMIGPVDWRSPDQRRGSDIANYGSANRIVIKDGTITQGVGQSDWSHALASESNSTNGHILSGLNIATNGANSQAIMMDSLQNGEIKFNTLAANMPTITSRDQMDGTVLTAYGANNKINNNVITNGVQGGIRAGTIDGQIPTEIYNNDITLQGRYTNNFALSGIRSIIRDNDVHCGDGNNSCRGIFVESGTIVDGNTVDVQDLPRNQEYNGCQGYGTYGIQMEAAKNSEVLNNTVNAFSSNECPASAYRVNPDSGTVISENNLVHNNVFTAIATGSARAVSLKLSGVNDSQLSLDDNIFKTNRRWIYAEYDGTIDNLHLERNRWETVGIVDNPFYPFENFVWSDSFVKDMVFLDNSYGAGDQARFESEYFRMTTNWPNPETRSNFTVVVSDIVAPSAPSTLLVQ